LAINSSRLVYGERAISDSHTSFCFNLNFDARR